MTKRWISAILATLLLMTALSGWTLAEEKTPKEKLIDDLMSGMGIYERMFGDMFWALEYVEIYDVTRRWGDLQLARTALNLVLQDALELTPPVTTLTQADLEALQGEGIDASFSKEYRETFAEDRNEMLDKCLNYNWHILYGVFEDDVWKRAASHMRLFDEYAESYLQYSAITVDWLTTQTDDTEWIGELERAFAEKCPMSNQRRLKGVFSAEDVTRLAEEISMRLMELQTELSQSFAENKYMVYRDSDAYADGKLEQALKDNRANIVGLPALVPEAPWDDLIYPDIDLDAIDLATVRREDLLAQDYMYLWRGEDGKLSKAAVLDALESPPDACVIATRRVSREEMENNCVELELTEGIERVDLTGDSESLRVTFKAGESVFVWEWKSEVATVFMLENPVCFAPVWYIASL